MKYQYLLLAANMAANSLYAADEFQTVVHVGDRKLNITFTQDQPVVITESDRPIAIYFQKSDAGAVTIRFCDYSPPATLSNCSRLDVNPESDYYLSGPFPLFLQLKR